MRKDSGVDGDAQRIGQLSWMLFLKIFSDSEENWSFYEEGYESPIPTELQWSSWASDDEGITGDELLDFVNNKLFPTLKSLPTEGNRRAYMIRSIFEDAINYMKSGQLLRQIINKINEIDFNSSEDRHIFGDIYEQILKGLQSAGNAGEFYTPRAVTQFMTEMTDPQLGQTVLDPACGTGGFLACAINHMRKQVTSPTDEQKLQKGIIGWEKKQLPHILCTTNMILHGLDVPNIQHLIAGSLAKPLNSYGKNDRVDVILTNPPFGGMEEDGIENNFPADVRTKETADLFLVLIMKLLKEGGKCAMVLPDGALFGEGVKTRIKEKLLTECNLHTIIRLPKSVFAPYTPINTDFSLRNYDAYHGEIQLNTEASKGITPILMGPAGGIVLGIDYSRRIVYWGDTDIGSSASSSTSTTDNRINNNSGTINNNASKLIANVFAWIVETVLYGE